MAARSLEPSRPPDRSHHDVQQATGNEDHLLRLTSDEPRNRWSRSHDFECVVLRHVRGDADRPSHLAVDLDGKLDGLLARQIAVERRPPRIEYALGMTELLPELLG